MAKFVIECPDCGSYLELGTGLFAKKTVKCSCGRIINSKDDMLSSKVCPHCGNTVMYNQKKGEKATCPVCHQKINTVADKFALIDVKCPTCASIQKVNRKNETHVCTVCGDKFDVQKLIAQTELKNSGNASIIKWEGSEDLLVFKHPIENFNLGSQLVVRQGQQALFIRDGRPFDLFGPGRYTLETNIIPELNKVYNFDGNSDIAIQTEVYFINKVVLTGLRWGTPSKVRIMEQTLNFPVEIGARGSFNLEIYDSRTLISRLIGTAKSFVCQTEDGGEGYGIEYIRNKFADMIAQNVTSMLARIITENHINLLTIDTMKPDIARLLGNVVNNALNEFGLQIPAGQFYVTDIVTPDDDPNYIRMKNQYLSSLDLKDAELEAKKIVSDTDLEIARRQADARIRMVDAQAEVDIAKVSAQGIADSAKIMATGSADLVVIEAKGEAERIKLEGHAMVDVYKAASIAEADALKAKGGDYEKETARIVDSTIAENGVTFVNINVHKADKWTCPDCGKTGIESKFCPDCGAKKFAQPATWDCSCGKKNISSKFCPDCGSKKS